MSNQSAEPPAWFLDYARTMENKIQELTSQLESKSTEVEEQKADLKHYPSDSNGGYDMANAAYKVIDSPKLTSLQASACAKFLSSVPLLGLSSALTDCHNNKDKSEVNFIGCRRRVHSIEQSETKDCSETCEQ